MVKQKGGDSRVPATNIAALSQKLPAFDENALSALTDKIEQKFHKSNAPDSGQALSSRRKEKDAKYALKKAQKIEQKVNGSTKSRKRDAQGNVKDFASVQKLDSTKYQSKIPEQDDRDILLQEILALGGTEEDLDLVANAESDSEALEDEEVQLSAKDPMFKKDLSKLIAGLGIEGQLVVDSSDSEAEENNNEDEDWEDRSVTPPVATLRDAPLLVSKTDKKIDNSPKDPNRLIFESRPDWHAADLPELPLPDLSEMAGHRETILELKKYGVSLLEADSNLYASKHLSSTSSHRFLSTIMSSGTLSDKVSALTLVVQESPVHTTKSFESLLALAKKRSRGQAVTALGAMKDLLGVGVVLPADRRLRSFGTQPGLLGTLQTELAMTWRLGNDLPGNISQAHLISWAFEDWLKDIYFEMLKVLEGWCGDEVEYARGRAVTYVYELLKEKPEQESNLLRLLVNKLGDPDKKLASRTSYLVLQLETTHPLMKPIIIRAIESELLLRPGQSAHAKYYAINTLNQTILSAKEEEVARKLLSIYFDLFVALLKKPEIQKAAPLGPVMNKKGQVQGGGGHKGKKAMEKATKEEVAKQASEETTEKMISAVLTGVNRSFPFAKSDDDTLEKHMDMLFRITHSSNFNTSIQALMLIQQLAVTKNIAVERFYRTLYESLLDPRLITSSKHAMYLNLLFRALKSDLNIKRVKAFAKRLLQVVTLHQPPFICGVLYLLRELEVPFPGLTSMLEDPEQQEDLDEEVFRDVPDDMDMGVQNNEDNIHPDRIVKQVVALNGYDGRKRDPEHSHADKSCFWELLPFIAHFHPSVSMFASRLLSGNEMPTKPDLASHTLSAFLDKFVYRNAKATAGGLRGSSIMQPLAGGDSRGVLVSNKGAQGNAPVNSESFWRKKIEDVAVEDVFFHRYFSSIGKTKQNLGKQKAPAKNAEGGDASDEDGENEDEIWQALVDSRPEVEGNSDDDSDLEMLDLDDSEDDSSDNGGALLEDESDDDIPDEATSVELDDDEEGSVDGGENEISVDELFNKELQTSQADIAPETSRSKKRKLKNLPTFASAEDYEKLLMSDGDDA